MATSLAGSAVTLLLRGGLRTTPYERYASAIFSPSDTPVTASDGVFLFLAGGVWNL